MLCYVSVLILSPTQTTFFSLEPYKLLFHAHWNSPELSRLWLDAVSVLCLRLES